MLGRGSGATLDWVPWYPGEPNGTGTVASFYNINGGPRLTLDDTFESDARQGLIVEFQRLMPHVRAMSIKTTKSTSRT